MIETKDIKKMVSHIIRRDKGIADTNIMHPAREWFTGLVITTIIVAAGTWFSFYVYVSNQNEMNKETVVIESAVPYNAAAVSGALELFATKQQNFNKILGGRQDKTISQPTSVATTTVSTAKHARRRDGADGGRSWAWRRGDADRRADSRKDARATSST